MKVKVLNDNLNTDNFIEDILFRNGIYDIDGFLNLEDTCIESPNNYDNMKEAYDLLQDYISDDIGILVDCDIDGYTSASVIYLHIKELNPDARIQLFFHDGKQHGLSDGKVYKEIVNSDIKMLIIPDAGSNEHNRHRGLYNKGIRTLVIDHHECEKYSEYAVVINNQLSENVINKRLSGVGVVYKFLEYCSERDNKDYHSKYIDLVALGNIGDVMSSLEEETRYLCLKGINNENLNNRLIRALILKYINDDVNMTTIAWNVVPKVNAIIRAGSMEDKIDMFEAFINPTKKVKFKKNSRTPESSVNLSTKIVELSEVIKKKQDDAIKKGVLLFEDKIDSNSKVIIIKLEDELDKSYTGLVANKLMGIYKRPILLFQKRDNDTYGGSCRSPLYFCDIDNFKEYVFSSGLFELAEGHSNAFGVEIKSDNIDKFQEWIDNELKDKEVELDDYYEVEAIINAEDLTDEFIIDVGNYAWFWGNGINEPRFLIKNVKVDASEIDMVCNKTILRFNHNWIQYNKKFCSRVFRERLYVDSYESKELTLDIIGTLILEEYNGKQYPKVNIIDVDIISEK